MDEDGNQSITRRRIMKLATTTGASTYAATSIASKRTRAAGSAQMMVSMDRKGWTREVPKDWYNRVERARRAQEKLKDRFLDKDGIIAVEYSPGQFGGENPYVAIVLDRDSAHREERRGNVPERKEETPVRVETTASYPRHSGAAKSWACDQCDQPCDDNPLSDKSKVPGGVKGSQSGYYGTLTSQAVNGSKHSYPYGWMTNAHVASAGNDNCGADLIGTTIEHYGHDIGTVEYVSHGHDMVYIASNSYTEPLPRVTDPENHSTEVNIEGTLTDDGIDVYAANSGDPKYAINKYGTNSCYTSGYIHRQGASVTPKNDSCRSSSDTYEDQVTWGDACDDIDCGDSGSLAFVKHTDEDYYLGVCLNSGPTGGDRVHGTSGDAMRDYHDLWWDDF